MEFTLQQKLDALRPNAFFREVPGEAISRLAQKAQFERMESGKIIFEEGDAASLFYLLIEGTVTLTRQSLKSQRQTMISQVQSGHFFGELALLENTARTTRSTTSTPCLVAEIDAQDFLAILKSESQVVTRNLFGETVRNLRMANERILTDGLEEQKKEVMQTVVTSWVEQQQDLITSIRLISERLERELMGQKSESLGHELKGKVHQVIALVDDLREYTFPTGGVAPQRKNLRSWWESVREGLSAPLVKRGLRLESYVEDLALLSDYELLSRMIQKLFDRISDISPSGQGVDLKIGGRDQWVDFQVGYQHPGLTEYTALRLCEPFLSYGNGRNTWVDFALVRQWAGRLGGNTRVANRAGGRVTFVVSLPLEYSK